MSRIILLPLCFFFINSLTLHAQTIVQTYGPIKSGDMLWNIAAQVRPNAAVNRYQVMIALLKANPQAFEVSCNMNSLKVGKILQIPNLSDMQALTQAQALEEFNRQRKEWQAYRRQKQTITCIPPTQQQVIPLAKKPSQPVIKNVKEVSSNPPATPPVILTSPANSPNSNPNEQSKPKAKTVVNQPPLTSPSTDKTFSPTDYSLNQLASELLKNTGLLTTFSLPFLATPVPLIAIISIILLLFLLIIVFARRWRSSPRRKKTESVEKQWLHDPLEKMPVNNPNLKAGEETHQAVNIEETTQADSTATVDTQELPNYSSVALKMEEKLDQVRAYLANDQTELTENMLREVLQNGSREQQAEALQLYKISQKITQNFPNNRNKTYVSLPQVDASNNPFWQELEQMNGHLPTQYLPENQERIFELIDKVFALLDHELNAHGKLIEAYKHRHHPEWIDNTYRFEKTMTQTVNEVEENHLSKSRIAPEATRHL
jgi:FimV-like protein